MKTFSQWLNEKSKRTGLGIYPPLYSVGQTPPLYKAPSSASHLVAYSTTHCDWPGQRELLSEPIKKACKKNKKKGKQVKLLKKNPWARTFGYTKP